MAAADEDDAEISEEVYFGVVKSYNDRRGFGFLACAETADKFGRDVYMPKAEATAAAAEAAAMEGDSTGGAAGASVVVAPPAPVAAPAAKPADKDGDKDGQKTEKPPPVPRLAEDDLVRFRVKLSIEGYPQAACVKRLRKFPGIVVLVPTEVAAGDVDGEDQETPGRITSNEVAKLHGVAEVPVRRLACGQVRLAVGDEVTFCVPAIAEMEDKAAATPENGKPRERRLTNAEASLVALAKTSRSNRSVLGCFTLDLPRTGGAEGDAERPNLQLDCHAFGDKLILAGLPQDLEEAELMRFFSKQAASSAIVAHARTCSFASVSFPGTVEVARFLGRTAHAFADEKETRIARLLSLSPNADSARLPALPSPSLNAADEAGSLLVVWSPLVLAVAYSVELRPINGVWATVDVTSNSLGTSDNRFDSECSSCKVTGLDGSTGYEARVSYFTECGTRSEASEPSEQCLPATPALLQAPPAVSLGSLAHSGFGAAEGFCGQANTAAAAPPATLAESGAAAVLLPLQDGSCPCSAPLQVPPATLPQEAGAALPEQPWPVGWPPQGTVDGSLPPGIGGPLAPLPPLHGGFVPALSPYLPATGWRSITGLVVPPPATPELKAGDDHGFSLTIQWPAVLQASAYVVELCEAGSATMERFVRSAPEAREGTVVELRVGGLRPGPPPGRVYVAQVRTVGGDGSESPASLPGWSPPLGASQQPQSQPQTPTQMSASGCVASSDAGGTDGVALASAATAPAPAAASVTVSSSGGTLSADAVPWQPQAFVPPSDAPVVQPPLTPAAGELQGSPGQMAPTLAPPMMPAATPPPQHQPSPPAGLSNWAPPPWLWQAEPGAAPFGPLGGLAPPPGSPPGGCPGCVVGPVVAGAPSPSTTPSAAEAAGVPWGAPGAPPPPPAGPPSTVQPGQRPEGDDEAAGHEECLILD